MQHNTGLVPQGPKVFPQILPPQASTEIVSRKNGIENGRMKRNENVVPTKTG